MLKVNNISKTYKRGLIHGKSVTAVDNLSFFLNSGETLGLIGKSGCGKSTAASIISGLISPDEGTVLVDGQNINRMSLKERTKKIQLIFQHPESSLDPSMTIEKSLREPLRIHNICKSGKEEKNLIKEMIKQVNLDTAILTRYPHQISGGEAQRICLARAIVLKPSIIILDEATSMLDVSVQAHVMEILKKLQKSVGFSSIFISHDLDVVKAVCDKIILMKDGRVIETADNDTFFKNPKEDYTKSLIESFAYFD